MSTHGYQMGGCVGSLKTLQRLCREYQPSAVYFAWEGGGSTRRRKIYPEYKSSRKPGRLNRFYEDDIPDSESNRKHQLITLLSILKHTPVCQVYVSDCEGDDIVAYLCRGPLRGEDKVIVTADKDMYQLLDVSTRIYSLYKKNFVTQDTLYDEYRIKSHNFCLAKALCGDDGDNVPGLQGMGFKTVAKKFPMLASDETLVLQDLIDYSASHKEESVSYRRVVEGADVLRRNWQLVHLDGSMLSPEQARKVDFAIDTFDPRADKMSFIRLLVREGINDFDFEGFFYDLRCVEKNKQVDSQ